MDSFSSSNNSSSLHPSASLFSNQPLKAALVAFMLAQFLKVLTTRYFSIYPFVILSSAKIAALFLIQIDIRSGVIFKW